MTKLNAIRSKMHECTATMQTGLIFKLYDLGKGRYGGQDLTPVRQSKAMVTMTMVCTRMNENSNTPSD